MNRMINNKNNYNNQTYNQSCNYNSIRYNYNWSYDYRNKSNNDKNQ